MPVIIRPQPDVVGVNRDRAVRSESELLRKVSYENKHRRILRSSLFDLPDGHGGCTKKPEMVPYKQGFVHGVLRAFQQDLHLTLRPDDVWLAIMTQFTFFVNGHADELRSSFVHHAHQETLSVDMRPQTLASVDMGLVARKMAALVQDKLVDPAIASMLLPEFTTTTDHDRATAAMVFLGSTQSYFRYEVEVGCGFPSVTLLGERADWAAMRERVSWFASLGGDGGSGGDHQDTTAAAAWSRALSLALMGMVASFDAPEADETRDFWMRACHAAGAAESGGPVTLSGWLTAFCWWTAAGTRQREFDDEELEELGASRLPDKSTRRLVLDGVEFPIIARDEIPSALARIPLTVVQDDGEDVETLILAGITGMYINDEAMTQVQPASGWWMLLGDQKKTRRG